VNSNLTDLLKIAHRALFNDFGQQGTYPQMRKSLNFEVAKYNTPMQSNPTDMHARRYEKVRNFKYKALSLSLIAGIFKTIFARLQKCH